MCQDEKKKKTNPPEFELWMEFENCEPKPTDGPTDEFTNVAVQLPDGRRYAMNVWTFKFLLGGGRYPWPYQITNDPPAKYVVAPDLIVERLDRPTMERIVQNLLINDEMKAEWICEPDSDDDDCGQNAEKAER